MTVSTYMVEFRNSLAEYSHARHSRPMLAGLLPHSEIGANFREDSRGASPRLYVPSASLRLRVKYTACLVPASPGGGAVYAKLRVEVLDQARATASASAPRMPNRVSAAPRYTLTGR